MHISLPRFLFEFGGMHKTGIDFCFSEFKRGGFISKAWLALGEVDQHG